MSNNRSYPFGFDWLFASLSRLTQGFRYLPVDEYSGLIINEGLLRIVDLSEIFIRHYSCNIIMEKSNEKFTFR